MKIDSSLKSVGGIASEGVTGKNGRAGSAKPEPGVSVELSSLSSRLRVLDPQASGGEVVDAARVSEIKLAISEGRLKINADVVADRLLETVRKLLVANK